ncbi:hypothetical protein HQN89_24770 [Paenibacillus frigoriresistens]|uniref:hypothetical protein n=1 Tax=Paenibacillus alginolyticus TaxID=59839 RepID=UPI0015641388|nr:hypothetical protein [Paenibacillus frigoriresistens]NRF94136.1 hypothetical protein [Paenibacillus frigoriresistens]
MVHKLISETMKFIAKVRGILEITSIAMKNMLRSEKLLMVHKLISETMKFIAKVREILGITSIAMKNMLKTEKVAHGPQIDI